MQVDLADQASRSLFFGSLRERPVGDRARNTGYLRGWVFRDRVCAERYFHAGHENFRVEAMVREGSTRHTPCGS